jgi:hypothetical protein
MLTQKVDAKLKLKALWEMAFFGLLFRSLVKVRRCTVSNIYENKFRCFLAYFKTRERVHSTPRYTVA